MSSGPRSLLLKLSVSMVESSCSSFTRGSTHPDVSWLLEKSTSVNGCPPLLIALAAFAAAVVSSRGCSPRSRPPQRSCSASGRSHWAKT
eukprot:scaffold79362_cov32-Tisochrysis_lutea.AAC.2